MPGVTITEEGTPEHELQPRRHLPGPQHAPPLQRARHTRQKIAGHEAQLAAINRTGEHRGFAFTPPNRYRSAHLGDKPEPTITLIDKCIARTRGVGASSYQILCGVAHAPLHGLSRFLMTDTQSTAAPGKIQTQLNIRAGELAQQLLVGPLCTTTLIEHLRWFLGWDTTQIDRSVTYMTNIWCRISGIPPTARRLR